MLNYRLITPPTVEPVPLSLAKQQIRVDIPDDNALIQSYISTAREWCENYTNRAFFTQTWQLSRDTFPYGDFRSTIPQDQRSPWNFSAYWNDLAIRLPKPRTLAVTSFNYIDADYNQQVLNLNTDYLVDFTSEPSRLVPLPGSTWPMTQFYVPGSVQITYQSGSFVTLAFSETLPVMGSAAPYTATLSATNLGITSVKDGNGNPVTYTAGPVLNGNSDDTGVTQLTFNAAVAGNSVTVVYNAGHIPPTIKQAILLIVGHLYEHREENSEVNLKTIPMAARSFLKRHIFQVFGNYSSGY